MYDQLAVVLLLLRCKLCHVLLQKFQHDMCKNGVPNSSLQIPCRLPPFYTFARSLFPLSFFSIVWPCYPINTVGLKCGAFAYFPICAGPA